MNSVQNVLLKYREINGKFRATLFHCSLDLESAALRMKFFSFLSTEKTLALSEIRKGTQQGDPL